MIPINRDTMMLVATVVCVAGLLFLFREVNTTKQDVSKKLEAPQLVAKEPEPEVAEEKVTE